MPSTDPYVIINFDDPVEIYKFEFALAGAPVTDEADLFFAPYADG